MSKAKITKEQIEDAASRGTTDWKQVECFYFDANFALVKWPGNMVWDGRGMPRTWVSGSVKRYAMSVLRESLTNRMGAFHDGCEVWDCARGVDGALTKKKKQALIEREKGR